MSSPVVASEAAGPKKIELSVNESWLLSNAMMHHKMASSPVM